MEFNIKIILLIIAILVYIVNGTTFICPTLSTNNIYIYDKKNIDTKLCGVEHVVKVDYVYINTYTFSGKLFKYATKDVLDKDETSRVSIYEPIENISIVEIFNIYIQNTSLHHYNNSITPYTYTITYNDTEFYMYEYNVMVIILNNTIENIYNTDSKTYIEIDGGEFKHVPDSKNDYYNLKYYFSNKEVYIVNKTLNATLISFINNITFLKITFSDIYIKIFKSKFEHDIFYYNETYNGIIEEITFVDKTQFNNIILDNTRHKRSLDDKNKLLYDYTNVINDNYIGFMNYIHLEWNIIELNLKRMCKIIMDFNEKRCLLNPKSCIDLNNPYNTELIHDNTFILNNCSIVKIEDYYFNESMCYAYIKVKYYYDDNSDIGYLDQNTGEIFSNNIKIRCRKVLYFVKNDTLYYISEYTNYTMKEVNKSYIQLINLYMTNIHPDVINYTNYVTNKTHNPYSNIISNYNKIKYSIVDNNLIHHVTDMKKETDIDNTIESINTPIIKSIYTSYKYISNKVNELKDKILYYLSKPYIYLYLTCLIIILIIILNFVKFISK